jgi:hypothetical protein
MTEIRETGEAMTRTTTTNPIGLRSFDHSAVAELPEYHAAAEALNALVHALEGRDVTQEDWLKMVADVAAALPASQCCFECQGLPLMHPWRVEVDAKGGADAYYRCPQCGTSDGAWWMLEFLGW